MLVKEKVFVDEISGFKWNSLDNLRDKLADVAIKTLQKMLIDNEQRKANFKKDPKDIKQIEAGAFYAEEYYELLEKGNQEKHKAFLKEIGSFYHGYISPKHFCSLKDKDSPTGTQGFKIKKDVLPSEALKAAQIGLWITNCAHVIDLAYYEALRQALGDEKFNYIFAYETKTPLSIHGTNPLIIFRASPQKSKPLKGQIVYIESAYENQYNLYDLKHHYTGESKGFNLLCSDPEKQKYIGFGLNPSGVTKEEVSEKLRKEYNKKPLDPLSIMTSEVVKKITESLVVSKATIESYKHHTLSVKEFKERDGGKIKEISDFNIELIDQLAKDSLDEARTRMEKYYLYALQYV